jgi:hypothetical protein
MTEISDNKKWFISILSGVIFYVIAAPRIYEITGKVINKFFGVKIENKGKPNNLGLLIHTIIFVLITRFLMNLNL